MTTGKACGNLDLVQLQIRLRKVGTKESPALALLQKHTWQVFIAVRKSSWRLRTSSI